MLIGREEQRFLTTAFLILGVQSVCSWRDRRDPQWPHPRHEAGVPQATADQWEPLRLLHVTRATQSPRRPVLFARGREVPQPRVKVPGADFRLHHGLVQPVAEGCSRCRYTLTDKKKKIYFVLLLLYFLRGEITAVQCRLLQLGLFWTPDTKVSLSSFPFQFMSCPLVFCSLRMAQT